MDEMACAGRRGSDRPCFSWEGLGTYRAVFSSWVSLDAAVAAAASAAAAAAASAAVAAAVAVAIVAVAIAAVFQITAPWHVRPVPLCHTSLVRW